MIRAVKFCCTEKKDHIWGKRNLPCIFFIILIIINSSETCSGHIFSSSLIPLYIEMQLYVFFSFQQLVCTHCNFAPQHPDTEACSVSELFGFCARRMPVLGSLPPGKRNYSFIPFAAKKD